MGLITLAGEALIGGTLCMPRVGAWHMDAVVDAAAELSGDVKVKIGDALELSGHIVAGAPYTDTGYYRVVGGKGGMRKNASAKAFGQCQLRVPLGELLRGVGESLADDSTASVLNLSLPAWSILGVPAGRQLAALLQAGPAGTSWRFLPGGALWVGLETWPTTQLTYEETGALPHEHKIEIATEDATLLPGYALEDGRRVSYVEHKIESGKLRSLVYLEAP